MIDMLKVLDRRFVKGIDQTPQSVDQCVLVLMSRKLRNTGECMANEMKLITEFVEENPGLVCVLTTIMFIAWLISRL